MYKLIVLIIAGLLSACSYGPNSNMYKEVTYNYPPVGYVLQAQPASNTVCAQGTVAVYQTFWTYDTTGRFNPTQQYVCAPYSGGRNAVNPTAGYPTQPVAPVLR